MFSPTEILTRLREHIATHGVDDTPLDDLITLVSDQPSCDAFYEIVTSEMDNTCHDAGFGFLTEEDDGSLKPKTAQMLIVIDNTLRSEDILAWTVVDGEPHNAEEDEYDD